MGSAGIVLPITMQARSVTAFAQSMGHSPFMRAGAGYQDHVIVVLRLFGGNDGINTVVPYHDESYYKARSGSGVDVSIRPEKVLPLPGSGTLGFNPNFQGMHELFGEGKVAIVQNVGYPNQNLSHFRSTDIWLTASDAEKFEPAGWYGRYLEGRYPEYPERLPSDPYAIELGTTLGLTLVGRRHDMGIALFDLSYVPEQPSPEGDGELSREEEEKHLRGLLRQVNIFSSSIIAAQEKVPKNMAAYPDSTLGRDLGMVARLVAAGLGTQMYVINVDGFDTHLNHVARHNWLLNHVSEGIRSFQRDLEAFGLDHRVTTMTISEFGRRIPTVGTGTEHGAAAPLFVVGSRVNGGILGHDPDIDDLDADGNLKMEYDFRQIYSSVLGQWLGASDDEILAALPRRFEQLPIFKAAESSAGSEGSASVVLGQNLPNPASAHTVIPFDGIPSGAIARLTLHTLDGREILSRVLMPGDRSITIDTRPLPSGAYIYELAAGRTRLVRKMTVRH